MSVLEQRGVFWWHDEAIPNGLLAPDTHVVGLLRVEDNGRAVLELDGYLANKHGPMSAMAAQTVDRCIQGLLKGSNEHVLLCDLIRNGGRFSTNGISFEKFAASHCLVSRAAFASGRHAPSFDILTITLTGFEEWLRIGAIKIEETGEFITATFKRLDDLIYPIPDGTLTIILDVETAASGMLGTHGYSVTQTAHAKLSLSMTSPLNDLTLQFVMFEDLLKVLTGFDYELPWPTLQLLPHGSPCRWYFLRTKHLKPIEAPSYYNTVTSFPELRDTFGLIWSRWKDKREEFGPGFYLYLGTRRGMPMYIEHRFVNLVWGLEAFHRTRGGGNSAALIAKINRILDRIDKAKDKKWLARRLKDAHEPPLEQRLFEVFRVLPLDLDEKQLRTFCKACAARRNEVSHFGRGRHDANYTEFLNDLNKKNEALSVLYHALLLHELGIDTCILKRWVFDSFRSMPIKVRLVEAGLLSATVLAVDDLATPLDVPLPNK